MGFLKVRYTEPGGIPLHTGLRTHGPQSRQCFIFSPSPESKTGTERCLLWGPCSISCNSHMPVSNARSQQETSDGKLRGLILPTSKNFPEMWGGKKWHHMDESAPSSLERKYWYYFYWAISEAQTRCLPACLLKMEWGPSPNIKARVSPLCGSENVNNYSCLPQSISSITLASYLLRLPSSGSLFPFSALLTSCSGCRGSVLEGPRLLIPPRGCPTAKVSPSPTTLAEAGGHSGCTEHTEAAGDTMIRSGSCRPHICTHTFQNQ